MFQAKFLVVLMLGIVIQLSVFFKIVDTFLSFKQPVFHPA